MIDGRIWCNKCVMENIKRKNLSRILRTNVFFFGARVRAVILTHSTKDMMTILHARILSGQLFTTLLSTLSTFQKFFSKTDVQIKFWISPTWASSMDDAASSMDESMVESSAFAFWVLFLFLDNDVVFRLIITKSLYVFWSKTKLLLNLFQFQSIGNPAGTNWKLQRGSCLQRAGQQKYRCSEFDQAWHVTNRKQYAPTLNEQTEM